MAVGLPDIKRLLTAWDFWKRIEPLPDRIDALESRIAALEAALERRPGEDCPFCGARAWRLKGVMMNGRCESWHCTACTQERDYRLDLGQKSPAGR